MNDTSNIGVNDTGMQTTAEGVAQAPVAAAPVVTNNVEPMVSSGVVMPEPVSVAPMEAPVVNAEPMPTPISLDAMISSATVVGAPNPTEVAQPYVAPASPLVEQPAPAYVAPASPLVEPQPAAPAYVAPASPLVDAPAPVAAPAPTPAMVAPAPVAPTPSAEENKIEINTTDVDASDIKYKEKEKVKDKPKTEEKASDDNQGGVNKAPIVIVVIFLFFLILLLIYYFVIMTPRHVFETAINDTVAALGDAIDSVDNSNTKNLNLKFDFDLSTDEEQFKYSRLKDIKRLDGEKFRSNISVDLERGNLLLTLSATRPKKLNEKKVVDVSIYSYDGYTYVLPKYYYNNTDNKIPFDSSKPTEIENDKVAQGDIFGMFINRDVSTRINIERVREMYQFAEDTKTRIQHELTDDQLHRTIALKKINQDGRDTTAVALKVHCKLNNEEIAKIDKTIFGDWNKGESPEAKEAIAHLMSITSLSEKEIKDKIEELYNRKVVTQDIDVNLYMNLANTELISLDVTVDNKYHAELSLLNGYYSIRFSIYADDYTEENDHRMFDIQATYDNDKGIVDGVGHIDNENGYLIVDFYYKRVLDESGKKDGNNLILKFYSGPEYYDGGEGPNDKPYGRLDCSLDFQQNEMLDELKDFDPSKAYSLPVVVEGIPTGNELPIDLVNATLGGANLTVSEITKTNADPEKLAGQLNLFEATDFLKFQIGFMRHVDFLVDHLLRSKIEKAPENNKTMPFTKPQETNKNDSEEKSETETKEETSTSNEQQEETKTTTESKTESTN